MKEDLRFGHLTSSEVVCLTGEMGLTEKQEEELAKYLTRKADHIAGIPKVKPLTAIMEAKLKELQKEKDKPSLPKAALTYIGQTLMERRLGKKVDSDAFSRPTTWGKLIEWHVQQKKLGLEYSLMGTDVLINPDLNYHRGSPDCIKENTVCDIKGPFTLNSFCLLVDPLYFGLTGMDAMNAIRFGFYSKNGKGYLEEQEDSFKHQPHPDGNKYYFQLVSNSILAKAKYAELIVYVPSEEEVKNQDEADENSLKHSAYNYDGGDQNQFTWIEHLNSYDQLPYLTKDSKYESKNIINFLVPEEDKLFLMERINMAGKYLTK